MPEGEQHRPFTDAFREWFATAIDVHHIMSFEPCGDRDAVEINFSVGGRALEGHANSGGVSVAAILRQECWDLLLDEDVVAENGSEGWSCSLCAIDDRRHYHSITNLWEDHLFRPLKNWIVTSLIPARAISFHSYEGATWAALIGDAALRDPQAHVAPFN
jgi:hypothetical protein